jgi:hypothetical protein
MAKETFQRCQRPASKEKLGRILLIGSIKKALGLSFHEEDWPLLSITEEDWGF